MRWNFRKVCGHVRRSYESPRSVERAAFEPAPREQHVVFAVSKAENVAGRIDHILEVRALDLVIRWLALGLDHFRRLEGNVHSWSLCELQFLLASFQRRLLCGLSPLG